MAEMTKELMDLINGGGYCYWGTASKDGIPNVAIYRATRAASPDTIVVSSHVMGKTFKNIQENPRVSVIVYSGLPPNKLQASTKDYMLVSGGQVKGSATLHTSGEVFEQTKARTAERMGAESDARLQAVVVLKVEEIYSVGTAPDAGKRIA